MIFCSKYDYKDIFKISFFNKRVMKNYLDIKRLKTSNFFVIKKNMGLQILNFKREPITYINIIYLFT